MLKYIERRLIPGIGVAFFALSVTASLYEGKYA